MYMSSDGGTAMKLRYIYWTGLFACLLMTACSKGGDSNDKNILATVNDFKLTVAEFQNQLAADKEIDRDLKITEPVKKNYLDQIIQKQILIQEAKRLKLDQQAKFIRTIERYWEATLIRNLIDSKSQEIEKQVIVTQEEVQRAYEKLKKNNPALKSFSEMEPELTTQIRDEKKTAMFQKWVDELTHKAKIRTNEKLLDDM